MSIEDTDQLEELSLDVGLDDTKVYMLTTIDNPYNPFTQFDQWHAFDSKAGYNSNQLLSRIAQSSDELSERSHRLAISTAIDQIIQFDPLNVFVKVTKDSFRDRTKKV